MFPSLVNHAVVKFGKLGVVPAVCRSDKIACDALQAVDDVRMTAGTFLQICRRVLIAALHAAVTVVVYRAVADVVFVHQVNDIGYGFRIVGGVAVYFHIEYVTAARHLVVRSLDFRFMAGRAVVVNGDMIGVGVIDFVSDTLDYAERLAVFGRKFAGQAFGRCGENGEVVVISFGELVGA